MFDKCSYNIRHEAVSLVLTIYRLHHLHTLESIAVQYFQVLLATSDA
ncbi:hypothetical protein [Nostoc sp.]